jgi:type VI secretion system protein ImpJ
MRLLNRVVWNEGMHLSQHHFQLQARYLEEAAAFQAGVLHFRARGFSGLELDQDALLNGTVSLVHARGILPDGLPFNIPEGDAVPEPIALGSRFSPTADRHLVYLAIPPHRPGSANCPPEGEEGTLPPRYRPDVRPVMDEVGGVEEVPVAFARKNLRLVLEGEETGDSILLPMARVRRDGSGRFVYDPGFIPPLLQIGASPRLMERLAQLVEILETRGDALASERAAARGQTDYGSREVATFWLAHAVHSALPGLRHQLEGRRAHPERLFVELSRLGGALCTFSLEGHPADLPAYDHDDLAGCFGALDRHIRSSLQLFLPQNRISIPLDATRPLLQTASVADRRCFQKAHWFLGVRSAMAEGELAVMAPRLMKICSAKHIARLVKEAYPGIGMRHVASPPADLAPRLGTVYFALDRTEPCWPSIVETGELGVYVPAAIPAAELELVVVLEGG